MSNKQNLAFFAILVAFVSVLGFLVWTSAVVIPDADSSPGVSESEGGPTGGIDLDAVDGLGEGSLTAQGEEAERSMVEVSEPELDPDSILLSGRLVDENQRPIVDQSVNFRPHVHFDISDLAGLRELAKSGGGLNSKTKTIEATTDGEGNFAMRVQKNEKGSLLLLAEADALFAKTEGIALQVAGYTQDVDLGDLSLIPGAVLAGRVVDQSGQPVAAVNVKLGATGRFGFGDGRNSETTGVDGKFEFRSLRPGKHVLSTTVPGYVPSSHTLELAKGEKRSDMTVRLEQGASISGVVLDDEGKPIVDAKVASYRKRELGGNVSIRRFDDHEAVETDANGYFALAGIEAEAVVLRAFAEGYGDQQIEGVQVGSGNVTFHLPRHGKISGVLVDGRGDPIAGSRVWIRKDRGIAGIELFEDLAETESAEDGSFVIEGVPAGDLLVTADGELHRPVEPMPVTLRPGGEARDLRLIADTGAVIDVLVLDERGDPIEGAEVKVQKFKENRQRSGGARRFVTRNITARSSLGGGGLEIFGGDGGVLGRGKTDADGRVRISGLPVAAVSLNAEHETMISAAGSRVELDASRVLEHQLVMKPGGFIQIESFDANGDARPETLYEVEGPMVAGQESKKKTGQTNGEGIATIGPLPAGNYSAVISMNSSTRFSPGGGMSFSFASGDSNTLAASRQTLVVRPGETTEISLVRPILTLFEGILSDASGPVASAHVAIRTGDGPNLGALGRGGLKATTDRDGRFSIEDVQAGTYTLEYGREGALVMHEEELVIPPAQPQLSRNLLLTGGSVRILVQDDQDGMPIERAKVSVRKPGSGSGGGRTMNVMMVSLTRDGGSSNTSITMGGGPATATTDEDGVALLEDLPPGEYVIEIKHQRFANQSIEDVKVVDGKVTDPGRVQMSPAGFIRGTVTGFGETGGMRMALIELKQVGSDEEPKKQPAMNGSFSFDGLRPGLYELKARRLGPGGNSDQWGVTQTVEVVAGKRARPQVPLPVVR